MQLSERSLQGGVARVESTLSFSRRSRSDILIGNVNVRAIALSYASYNGLACPKEGEVMTYVCTVDELVPRQFRGSYSCGC